MFTNIKAYKIYLQPLFRMDHLSSIRAIIPQAIVIYVEYCNITKNEIILLSIVFAATTQKKTSNYMILFESSWIWCVQYLLLLLYLLYISRSNISNFSLSLTYLLTHCEGFVFVETNKKKQQQQNNHKKNAESTLLMY